MTIISINEMHSQATSMGVGQAADPVSKNIQAQIANTQKQLQELSENSELNLETKMKKRQELQQQINDLNNQLRQHQIELRKRQQEEKQAKENASGNTQNTERMKAEKQEAGLSTANMQAMISADSTMKQAQVQGNAAAKFEGRIGVLETEIMLYQSRATNGRTANVSPKKEQLAEARQKIIDVTTSQTDTLKEVNDTINEVQEKERKAEYAEGKKTEASDRNIVDIRL